MALRLSNHLLAALLALATAGPACTHLLREESAGAPLISFYIYAPGLSGADRGDAAVREQFGRFLDHLGRKSSFGRVGVALNYPYTAFVTGHSPDDFSVNAAIIKLYEANVRVAKEMGIPIMVGFNDGPWASADGAFNAYWKTAQDGRWLARYRDGQVNEAIRNTGPIKASELHSFLSIGPYDAKERQNTLFLTLSADAKEYQQSRLRVLELALREWERIDRLYPGTIQTMTTDSEVSDFSFRSKRTGESLPIGYEDAMTDPFCRRYEITDCRGYFKTHQFNYKTSEDLRWFEFRADSHRQFVSATVNSIRKFFPSIPIFTHQLGTLDKDYLEAHGKQDFASPQESAFVPGAAPGVTAYIYEKRDHDFRTLVSQVSEKASGGEWALAEFNPGKDWRESRRELEKYSYETLVFLASHHVSMIGLLAWESNTLDAGIKDSGIDDAVKRYLTQGPTEKP